MSGTPSQPIFTLADQSARLGSKIWTCTFDLRGREGQQAQPGGDERV